MRNNMTATELNAIELMTSIVRELFDEEDTLAVGAKDTTDLAIKMLDSRGVIDLHAPGIARAYQAFARHLAASEAAEITADGVIVKQVCTKCAVILCECGAYHETDGTVIVETDGGNLYRFAQTLEQVGEGDTVCDIVAQYRLSDDEVESLEQNCQFCEYQDAQ